MAWDRPYLRGAAYAPTRISRNRLKRWQRMAFLRFYARPGIFLRNLAGIRSPRHLFYLLSRFYRWILA